MEVAEGIHRIETEFGPRINAAYLLVGETRSLLVDPTTTTTAGDVLAACRRLGVEAPTWVLTTHADWDHAGGNGVVRKTSPGTLLMCHQADQAMIEDVDLMITDRYGDFAEAHGYDETPESKQAVRDGTDAVDMDLVLTGGERFRLGSDWEVEAVHTPGHSHGSTSIHDLRSEAWIVGDAVLGAAVPLANGDPAFPPTYRYVDEYLATIDLLRKARPGRLLTAHYPVLDEQAAADFLDETERFVDRADGALAAAIADGPVPLRTACHQLSASLGNWPPEAADALLFPLAGHLERMLERGSVEAVNGGAAGVTSYRRREPSGG